jgi:hypothetical protein
MTTHEKLRDRICELVPEIKREEIGYFDTEQGRGEIHANHKFSLEDVMRAMNKLEKRITFQWVGGDSNDMAMVAENYDVLGYWQLSLPLSQQSDETVEKILEILK